MKVFKFGGASVKDAAAVQNVADILQLFDGEKLAIVISAMGKTTNAMEQIAQAYWERDSSTFKERVEERRLFHLDIMHSLFEDKSAPIFQEINSIFDQLTAHFDDLISENFDFEYDQIVSFGEIVSTKIIAAYLSSRGLSCQWADARELIATDRKFREAEVDWELSISHFEKRFLPQYASVDIQITQGFIGSNDKSTTTLGREGSDFTAGIIAYCCDAESVTIWKDVPGMLNADPKWFDNTVKLDQISFREAIELSYHGASVIHPKTVKPLQNKNIPLHVKSFVNPNEEGTVIQKSTSSDHLIPSFIFKMDQVLFSFTPKDFSFIVEKNLSDIFDRLSKVNAKINLMQNSALSFSILVDAQKVDIQKIQQEFEDSYQVKFNEGLELVTIRHYDQATIDRVTTDKDVLLQQKTRETARLIVKQKILI
ncbi:aspartate kinase [Crocinitomicaceae bacterium]|nr:aspartate kinase [Crocinitomicaceae bacterium]MDC0257243.1 aspartate kinase [Crocinitomicaceae bacterium]